MVIVTTMMRRNLLLVSLCAVISVALGIQVHPNYKGGGGTLQRAGLRQRSGVRHRRLQAGRADRARPGSRALSHHTTSPQFAQGLIVNLLNTDGKLQLSPVTETFPFIWIPLSQRGTIVKVNTTDGAILGEYWSAPNGRGRNPSRTTVDHNGNVWTGNRAEGSGGGSIVHIGLEEFGQCIDRNNNGVIDTSIGLGDKRPWLNAGGADDGGGVSTAEDECIIHYVRTAGTNVRAVAVDGNNDVWVGGNNKVHEKISANGQPVLGTEFNLNCGGYGGLVDSNGVLWSATHPMAPYLLRYNTSAMSGTCINIGRASYGLGIDTDGNIWNSNYGSDSVTKLAPDGAIVGRYGTGSAADDRGVAVTPIDNNVWIANSGSRDVSRLHNNGTFITTIAVGVLPTGVAVDADGKVWVSNMNSNNAMRIDPATNAIDLTVDFGPGAYPYTYGDMTGAMLLTTHPEGTWTVTEDSGEVGTEWGMLTWNTEPEGFEPLGTSITVQARAHDIEASLNIVAYIDVSNGVTPPSSLVGKFLQVRVTLIPNEEGISPVLSDIETSLANTPPVALCTDAIVYAVAPDCNADASIDGGSNDAEDADPEIDESPKGPYLLGPTLVTLTITDEAGVSAECQATVTVKDNVSPTFLSVPADETLECAIGIYDEPGATATDDCDARPMVTTAGDVVDISQPDDYEVIYTATDASSNAASATRTVTVVDSTSPAFLSVPADETLECAIGIYDEPGATATDDCDTSFIVVTTAGDVVDISQPDDYEVIYTATDASSNAASATRTVTVVDSTSPAFLSVPADETLECAIGIYDEPGATATDDCDTSFIVVTTAGDVVDISQPDDYEVIYTATDASSNAASATRTVTVVDSTSPAFLSVPADETLECAIGIYDEPGATATDDCDTSFIVVTTAGDVVDISQPDDYEVIYTATDASSNAASETRTVTVVDSTSPAFLSVPADETLECAIGIYDEPGATATDDCDTSPIVVTTAGDVVDISQPDDYEVIYTATDASSNAASATRTVTVVDSTSPAFLSVPADETLECAIGIYDEPGATATDDCDTSFIVVTTAGDVVDISQPDDYEVIYTATDASSNAASATRTVTVVDSTSPAFLSVPADETLECAIGIYDEPGATATDDCDTSFIVVTTAGDVVDISQPDDYEVIYTATDASSNAASATRTVTVVDSTSPAFLSVPADETLECAIGIYDEPGATATDDCDTSFIVVTTAGDVVDISQPDDYEVIYTATDASSNAASETRTVTVVDSTSPAFLSVPADETLECAIGIYDEPGATATDDCDTSPIVVTTAGDVVDISQPDDYEVIYTATDASSNAASATRTVTVVDSTSPAFLSVPADETLECAIGIYDEPGATATDDCDTSFIVVTTAGDVVDISQPDDYEVIYTATDASSNAASATRTVTVVDSTSPAFLSVPADETLECAIGIYDEPGATATDDCDTSFIVVTTAGDVVDISQPDDYEVIYTATDASSNAASATRTVTVVDSTSPAFLSVPADETLECAIGIYDEPGATATDDCDTSFIVVTTAGDVVDISQPDDYEVIYTATDASSNAASATRTVTVVDSTSPAFLSVPADETLECAIGIYDEPGATATDDCDTSFIVVTTAGDVVDISQPDDYEVIYTATDASSNAASATRTVTVVDSTSPAFLSVPADETLECAIGIYDEPGATATDDCDTSFIVVTTAGDVVDISQPDDYEVIYTATDASSNAASATRTVTVVDSTSPAFLSVPADETLECAIGIYDEPGATATDDCDTSFIVVTTAGDVVDISQPDDYEVIYTATDASSNAASATRTVTVVDSTSPAFLSVPADETLECAIGIYDEPGATATDDCDTSFIVVTTAGDVVDISQPDDYEVIYTATDASSNAASATRTVTVVDSTSPAFLSVPADETLECAIGIYDEPGATATDDCDTSPIVVTTAGDVVDISQPDDYEVIYTATDASSNAASATRTVTVVDSTSPAFLSVPADETLECAIGIYDEPGATATDDCDTSFIVVTTAGDVVDISQPDDYEVIYTATDASSNAASATRTVTVVDSTSPAFLSVPADETLECAIGIYDEPGATATDDCDTSFIVVTTAGDVVDISQPDDYEVIYTATDASSNAASATRTVTVVDSTSPAFLSVPADETLECAIGIYDEPGATATDDCDTSPIVVTTAGDVVDISQPDDYEVIYTATDASNNAASETRRVTVVDTHQPTRVCALADPIKVGEIFHAVTSHSDRCDPSPTVLNSCTNYVVAGNEFNFTAAGVYACTATVVDHSGNSALCPVVIAVYDPTAGFVTGGGQIDSPAGAFKRNLKSFGKAIFGFESKYEGQGATIPKGHTNFVFKGGELHFTSNTLDRLVVTGGDYARFKGHGTIGHEEGIYKFHVWAGDGTGPSGEDTFRIKIWSEEEEEDCIYDNGMDQPINRGQIKLHVPKKRALRGG